MNFDNNIDKGMEIDKNIEIDIGIDNGLNMSI